MRLTLGVAVLVATTFAGTAEAQDAIARAHFTAATAHFDAGDYEGAIPEFEQAYALSHRPQLLFNLYVSHEHLGHLEDAVSYLERYLHDAADVPDRPLLQERLANLHARIERAHAEAVAREAAAHDVATPPVTPPPTHDAPAETGGGGPPLATIVSFVAAGAFAALFAVTGPLALSEDSRLAGSCGANAGRMCTDAQVSDLKTFAALADVGLFGALIGVTVGVVLWLVLGPDRPHAERPVARLGGAGLEVSL